MVLLNSEMNEWILSERSLRRVLTDGSRHLPSDDKRHERWDRPTTRGDQRRRGIIMLRSEKKEF